MLFTEERELARRGASLKKSFKAGVTSNHLPTWTCTQMIEQSDIKMCWRLMQRRKRLRAKHAALLLDRF